MHGKAREYKGLGLLAQERDQLRVLVFLGNEPSGSIQCREFFE